MKIKEELKGCWVTVSTILMIVVIGGLFLFATGTIGKIMFDIAYVLQNNMGKILISAAAIGIIIWIVKTLNKEK